MILTYSVYLKLIIHDWDVGGRGEKINMYQILFRVNAMRRLGNSMIFR